jgi:hypothetical protein
MLVGVFRTAWQIELVTLVADPHLMEIHDKIPQEQLPLCPRRVVQPFYHEWACRLFTSAHVSELNYCPSCHTHLPAISLADIDNWEVLLDPNKLQGILWCHYMEVEARG